MEKRAHARRCSSLPKELDVEGAGWWRRAPGEQEWVDLMIEAKDKEQAVFQLYRIYDLAPVIWENLRPEQTEAAEDGRERANSTQVRRRVKNRVNDKECVLELPAEVDPVTMVGEDLEGLPTVEEHVAEPENTSQARKKSSRGGKGKAKAIPKRD